MLSVQALPVLAADDITLYTNGELITMNDQQPSAEALAVVDGEILAVGQHAQVLAAVNAHLKKTENNRSPVATERSIKTVNLAGNTLLPGFIDAHGHFASTVMYLAFENLAAPPVGQVKSIEDIKRRLTQRKKSLSAGEWLLGRGYDEAYLAEGRHPTRVELDMISTEHPIALIHVSQHFISCNSKCLEIAGIDADTEDPVGGVIRRIDGSREPNGVLEERALYKVLPFLPIHNIAKFLALMAPAQDYFASYGITTLQDGASTASDLRLFERAAQQGLLTLDLIAYPTYKEAALLQGDYAPSLIYRDNWRIGGVKLGLDGSPQGKTAFLSEAYLRSPEGQPKDYHGYPTMAQAEVNRYIDEFFAKGWHTLVHANGDAAAQQMIDAVALATKKYGADDRRTTMIHAQTLRDDQHDPMKALGILPSYFVSHTFFWGDWHRDSVLGAERAANISPLQSALNRDMRYTLHNDAPIVPPDILSLVWSAVNRVTRSGKVLGPAQRVSALEALKGVTIYAAWQNFEEQSKGSLEVGKRADFVILAENPLRLDPMKIKDITVLETIKDGERVYLRQ